MRVRVAAVRRGPGRRQVLAALTASLWAGRASAGATPRLGAVRGPQASLLAYATTLGAARRLSIKLTISDDAAALARDLASGALDGIASHNAQELDAWNAAHGTALVTGFPTVTLPFGIYARKVHSITQLRQGDRIVLPRPALAYNRARVLLYNYGLLYAHEDNGLSPDFGNIVNPRGFVIETVDLHALAGRLGDAGIVVMPYDVAVAAGLRPSIDSIGLEDGKSPYTQVLAVRAADRGAPWLATLARSFQSREVRRFIYDHYGDSVQPPW